MEPSPFWPVCTSVPTVVPEEKQPGFFKNYFHKRIQKGLDLQGGLHLVYTVDIDKAVSAKVDHLANEDRGRRSRRRPRTSPWCTRAATTSW
jgi:preprotein translocase subunit SecD